MSRPEYRLESMWVTGVCPTGKRAYINRAAAKAAERIARKKLGNMRAFACAKCERWHLGHTQKHR